MTTELEKQTESTPDGWTDFDAAFDELSRHFLEPFGVSFRDGTFPALVGASTPFARTPRTDVSDTGKSYRIVAEVPGLPKDRIDIRVRGTSVEIRGEQATETEETKKQLVHRERSFAGFYRRLELPEPVLAGEATAKVENGVLELDLPKQTPTPSNDEVKVAVQ